MQSLGHDLQSFLVAVGGVHSAPDSPLLGLPARRKLRVDAAPVYQADLDAVRAADGDYLSLLSSNTRSQIRRAMKDHGGPLPERRGAPAVGG